MPSLLVLLRYMCIFAINIVAWVVVLPLLAGMTVFFLNGYLLGGTIDKRQVDTPGMAVSGSILLMLLCIPWTLVMSIVFYGTVIAIRRFVKTSSSSRIISISFASVIGVFFLFVNIWRPWFGLSFFAWGFLLFKWIIKLFPEDPVIESPK